MILKRFSKKKDFFRTTSFVMKIEFRCFFFNLCLSKYFLVLEWTTVIFPPIYIKLNWSIMGYVKGLVAESTRELWKKHKIFLQTFYFMHKYTIYYYLGFLKRNRNTKKLCGSPNFPFAYMVPATIYMKLKFKREHRTVEKRPEK